MQNLDELLKLAKRACVAAGAEILKFYQNFNVSFKSDNSPITQADLSANKKIIEILSPSAIAICSEEQILKASANAPELFWLIDPLDGTREFIKQNGEFCVCIALIFRAQVVLGVIFIPITGELFFATKDSEVGYENLGVLIKNNLKFSPLNLKQVREKTGKNLMFISGKNPSSERIANALNLHQIRIGSAIKFCLLARGDGGIYHRTHPSNIWDNAAGELIATQSGATIIDLKTLKAPKYELNKLKFNNFIVISKNFKDKKDEIVNLALS